MTRRLRRISCFSRSETGARTGRVLRSILIWSGLAALLLIPLIAAAASPLLAWRSPIYIMAGFAGIGALALLLLQPVLAGDMLPDLSRVRARRAHRWVGVALLSLVVLHVAGLWLTSPPDVVDALLFTSPTPFSAWGVIAMWALIAAAMLASLRRRVRIAPRAWRRGHVSLAVIVVLCTVLHVVLIDGTMETVSKLMLCGAALAAVAKLLVGLRNR